jgi:hypothetical protein
MKAFCDKSIVSSLVGADVRLTPKDSREIESVASKIKVWGDRYPENLMKMTGL